MAKLFVMMLAVALVCLFSQTNGQPGNPRNPRKPPHPPFGLLKCRLSRRIVPEINGCKPLSPVYDTTCSGRCHSWSGIRPALHPFVVYDRCDCCRPTAMSRPTVELECPGFIEDYNMTATCDNNMRVYFDGVYQYAPLSQLNNWQLPSDFIVPGNTQVIGIECEDLHVVGGILASFSNGVVTNDGWHCSSEYADGWNTASFVSTGPAWNPATEIGNNGVGPWGLIPGISSDAEWIWTPNWHGGDRKVYCRKVIPQESHIVEFTYNKIERCGCQPCSMDEAADVPEAEEELDVEPGDEEMRG